MIGKGLCRVRTPGKYCSDSSCVATARASADKASRGAELGSRSRATFKATARTWGIGIAGQARAQRQEHRVASLREDLVAEFDRLEIDLLYTEKAHFCAAEHFKLTHFVLGVSAAVASSVTAAAIWDERATLSAVLTLVAAMAAALLTFVKPLTLAAQHVVCARHLADLRFRVRQSRILDGHQASGVSDTDLRQHVAAFTQAKQQALVDAPTTGPLAFWRGQRKIKAGHFTYPVDGG